jgi:hypothetical protein
MQSSGRASKASDMRGLLATVRLARAPMQAVARASPPASFASNIQTRSRGGFDKAEAQEHVREKLVPAIAKFRIQGDTTLAFILVLIGGQNEVKIYDGISHIG